MDLDGKVFINRSRPDDTGAIGVPLDRGEMRDEWSGRAEGLLRPESLPRAGTNAWRDRPEPLCVLSPRARRG